MKPTNQQIANCTRALANEFNLADIPKIERILKSHFADEPEHKPWCNSLIEQDAEFDRECNCKQPSKSLDEIVEKYGTGFNPFNPANDNTIKERVRQAVIEYAAQLQAQLNEANKIIFEATKLSTSQTASAHQCQLVLSAMDYLKIEPTYQEMCEIEAAQRIQNSKEPWSKLVELIQSDARQSAARQAADALEIELIKQAAGKYYIDCGKKAILTHFNIT